MLHILLLALGGLVHIMSGALALPGVLEAGPTTEISPPAGVG